jgi:UDP-N-acetylglucosamine 4,6-dehydratase/5-epimerase
MNVLITGGTGTLGKELTRQLLRRDGVQRIVIYSRDEFKQHTMKAIPEFDPAATGDRIRWFIGDVRDEARLEQAMVKCTHVIHAAALKQVPSCEYNPQEAIKTNVGGTMAVLSAAIKQKIERCMVVSTDKAVQPLNLYGATKLCAEKLAIAYNSLGNTRISVVRYGNVIGSRGSVIEVWQRQSDAGEPLTITDPAMTRFWISIERAAGFVLSCLNEMNGGEVFVPKMHALSMEKLAASTYPLKETRIVGVRPGEKLHEILITNSEAPHTRDRGDGYAIYPQHVEWTRNVPHNGIPVSSDWEYNSKNEAEGSYELDTAKS